MLILVENDVVEYSEYSGVVAVAALWFVVAVHRRRVFLYSGVREGKLPPGAFVTGIISLISHTVLSV